MLVRSSLNQPLEYLENHHILQPQPYTNMLYNHTRYDVTSYLRSELLAINCRKHHLRQLRVEFLENGLCKDHEILRTYWGQSASQTSRIWRHLLRQLSNFEKRQNCRIRRLWVEFQQNGSREDHEIPRLSGTIGPQNLRDMTSLPASGRLQNATKYCTRVRLRGAAVIVG